MINELFAELKAIDKIEKVGVYAETEKDRTIKVRSVIIAHNGKSFSAGHELKELVSLTTIS